MAALLEYQADILPSKYLMANILINHSMLFSRITENTVILVFQKLFKHFKVFCFRVIGSGTKVEQSTHDPKVEGSKPAPEAEIIEKGIKLSQYWLT
jgi:hypothetical protein